MVSKARKKGGTAAVRIVAGITAVLVSPLFASLIGKTAGDLKGTFSSLLRERQEIQSSPISLEMNGSSMLLYKPAAIPGEIIPQKLPPIEVEEQSALIEPLESASDAAPSPDYYFPDEPAAQVLSQNIADIREDLAGFKEIDGRIVKTTFRPNGGVNFLNLDLAGQIRNETELDNDTVTNESRKLPNIKLEMNGEPEVLIMHTHTTEAYQPGEYDYYDASYIGRCSDPEKNIVSVGGEIAKSFAEAGITVIHDGTVHDSPEFSGAYARSAETVRQILKAYPSIKVVLDIHRDAIDDGDSRVAAVAGVDGRDAAQVMIISAADDGTYDIPDYMQNLRLASLFQQSMEYDYPGITRPVLFQYCQYNQHLTTGSLLIEVGAYGNTLEEAEYAGRLIGKSMARALLKL